MMEPNVNFFSVLKTVLYAVSDASTFLFTTIPGLVIVFTLLIGYIALKIYNRLQAFHLAWDAADQTGQPGLKEYMPQIWMEITEFAARIAASIPLLIGTIATLIILTALSSSMRSIDAFVENQKKIHQLSLAIAHVKDHNLAAEIEITEQTAETTTLVIRYYDYSKKGFSEIPEAHVIAGSDIYLDCIVINFDYLLIENAEKINFVIPYRLFSNRVEQEKGIPLAVSSLKEIPEYYRVNSDEIYGMEAQEFNDIMTDIFKTATDPVQMKKSGIRSLYGSAIHRKMLKGEKYQLYIEQSGGLVLKQKKL